MSKTFLYFDKENNSFESEYHFLTSKEICVLLNLYVDKKNGRRYMTRKLKTFLEDKVKSYYYRPNPKSTFNQITVYDIYNNDFIDLIKQFREENIIKGV